MTLVSILLLLLVPAPARSMHPHLPAWMTSDDDGGGACSSPLQCNAEKCYDCACTNGKCSCTGGFSGPNCQSAFCTNRTHGCSGHGNCVETLHNISCACDKYFSGSHCEIAQCQLDCKHGGVPNKGCTTCEGCKGAWSGKLCDKWDTSVPLATLMAQLNQITNASQQMLNDQTKFNPICKQGHECVGWGVNGVTGKPTPFPIVYLSYDPTRSDKKFNGMTEPVEVIANHVVDPVWASVDDVQSFSRVEEFVQHVNSVYQGATPAPKGTSGIYSRGFADVFQNFFQKSDDRALSVVRASKSYIEMNLPVDPTTHTRQYHFDRHANDFLNALPPTYSSDDDKAQFRKFIENWGTSFATSATLGGRVEQYSSWKTWITDARMGNFDVPKLTSNAKIDFYDTTGLPGSSGAKHDPGYDSSTVTVEPLNCQGGDATVSCSSNFAKWDETLKTSPVLLDYELAPISDLVEDPDIKKALEAAVKDFVAEEENKWAAANKCPPGSCSGAGTCKPHQQSSCSCVYAGRVGRMCSGCAPMQVQGTFTDIYGNTHTATSTLSCNDNMVSVWSGGVTCQVLGIFSPHPLKCNTNGRAMCARTKIGNLVARVEQDPCPMSDNPPSALFGRRLLSSRQGRRLLRHESSRDLGELHKKDDQLGCYNFESQSSPAGQVVPSSASTSYSVDKKQSFPQCIANQKKMKKIEHCTVAAHCTFV